MPQEIASEKEHSLLLSSDDTEQRQEFAHITRTLRFPEFEHGSKQQLVF